MTYFMVATIQKHVGLPIVHGFMKMYLPVCLFYFVKKDILKMKVKGIFELPYYVLFSFRTPYLLPTKNGCVFIVLSDNAIFKYQRNNFNFRSYLTSNNKTECGTFELQSDDGIYRSSANCQIVNFISFFYSEQ